MDKREKRMQIKEQVALLRREREEKTRSRRQNIIEWTLIIALFVMFSVGWAMVRHIDKNITAQYQLEDNGG